MNPVTHFLTSWVIANTDSDLDRRERAAITIAGISPDVDGLGIIPEFLTRGTDHPILWWSNYHHVFAHNLLFGLCVSAAVFAFVKQKWKAALLALAAFHVHLLADLVGGAGDRIPNGPSLISTHLTKPCNGHGPVSGN